MCKKIVARIDRVIWRWFNGTRIGKRMAMESYEIAIFNLTHNGEACAMRPHTWVDGIGFIILKDTRPNEIPFYEIGEDSL